MWERIRNNGTSGKDQNKERSKSDKLFEWAKSELDANEKRYKEKKSDVICELAPRLEEEGEIETSRISTEIAKLGIKRDFWS